ncbi:alpha/beta hydrolase [Microbacterium sp. NPDC096154]|uniref:alpha/beta fold hydrolase n=1 Tax=Microbacterium sp. NPDC096154 TaxID=3155549 RepID=UPI00332713D4
MPTERLFDLDGQMIRVFSSERAASSHQYVLVHGLGISHRLFSRLHGVLAKRHTVHTLDLPGFGGLPRPRHSPDVPAMARLIADVLDRIGARDVVAVGDSMGTQWVVELGALRADVVSHVVAIGPVVDDERRSSGAQAMALAADTVREPPSANARVLTEYLRCGPAWYSSQLRHMLAYPIEKRVGAVSERLMILRGGRDPIAGRDWCERLVARAPGSRLVEVAGHPHLVQHTAPHRVAEEIVRFVRDGAA